MGPRHRCRRVRAPGAIILASAFCTLAPLALFSRDQTTSSVRFHHLHFRVADPAQSMNQAATALNGTRVLLRGLGVGARIGNEYALFDRLDVDEAPRDRHLSVEESFMAARTWLTDHGVEVESHVTRARPALAKLFDGEVLDHVAFTTADTSSVISSLLAKGAKPWRQTDDSRLFRTATIGVEIVRDVEAPDAFWCPMHPDIRSSVAGRCPLCRMDLVPIPSPRVGEYRMDVAVTPAAGGRGASKTRLTLPDPDAGPPVSSTRA